MTRAGNLQTPALGVALVLGTETFDTEGSRIWCTTLFAYEVTELTRTVEADSVEESIALAYRGSDTDWTQWSEESLGTNGVELVCAESGEAVYDAGTRARVPKEEFDDGWL